jgi:hypothetical protein
MRSDDFTPMGGAGKFVGVDETYIGRLVGVPKQKSGIAHKNTVLTLLKAVKDITGKDAEFVRWFGAGSR